MATLRGHSRPVKIDGLQYVLDHTYATCGAGKCWPCWGDCLDGVVLKTGEGSSAKADRLSQPNSWAGIAYGITGLCHQTSNRILWPAEIMVSDATGYGITYFLFGTYGSDAVNWIVYRHASDGVEGEIPDCEGPESPVVDLANAADAAMFHASGDLYERMAAQAEREGRSSATPDLPLLSSLLEQRVQQIMGGDYPGARIEAMQQIQQSCLVDKIELDVALREGRISGVEFANRANRRINVALREVAGSVEARDYAALFQMRPGAEITVIRPDICEAVYDRDRGLRG